MGQRIMKNCSPLVPTVFMVVIACTPFAGLPLRAELSVEEQFAYTAGENINGQNGGIGFSGPWVSTISHGRIYDIESPGLSFSTLRVDGNAVSRFGSSGRAQANRVLTGAAQAALTGTDTTIWFSMLFQPPSAHRYASFLFGTGAFTTGGSPVLATAGDGFGVTLVAANGTSDGGGAINALAFDNATAPTVATSSLNPGTSTVLLAGKITWKAGGTPDEFHLFNITDLNNEPAEGTAIASITNLDLDQSAIDTIAIWDTNNAIIDEIRIATTFGEAMGLQPDSDGDGMPDAFEQEHSGSPTGLVAGEDLENGGNGDGLTNLQEYQYGTDPTDPDSDGDNLEDGDEVAGAGSRPATDPALADTDGDGLDDDVETNSGSWGGASATGTDPTDSDTDDDGLVDGVENNNDSYASESATGTDPHVSDSDADGAGDWYEVGAAFTDPNDPADKPNVPYPLPDPDGSPGDSDKPVKVYIMSGQSNMVAFGRVNGTEPGTLETISKGQNKFPNLVTGGGAWSVRSDVYYRGVISAIGNGALAPGFGANGSSFGPELGFGHVMGYYHPEPVLLIKSSIGNRSLSWDCLPPGSQSFVYNGTNHAGYGGYGNWAVGDSPPTTGGWYAGKQWDDYFLDEEDMGPTPWASGIAYPSGCQVRSDGTVYNCTTAHTSSASSEPGIGGSSSSYWALHSVYNVVDILDTFATEYAGPGKPFEGQDFEIAGFVWWQGHKDQGQPAADRYEQNMVNFIEEIRSYYENRYPGKVVPDAPFVLSTIAFGGWGLSGAGATVAQAQLNVSGETGLHPQFAGNVKTIEARSYWRDSTISPKGEGHHYNHNAETYMLVGDALGRAMVELQEGAATSDYDTWAALFPATDLSDPDGDADDDGRTNNEERIFGTDPSDAGSFSPTTVPLDAAGTLGYTRRDEALTGLSYSVWTSTSLETGSWVEDTGAVQVDGTPDANGVETVTVTISPALLSHTELFVRVQAQ